jgi:hypothetical protein
MSGPLKPGLFVVPDRYTAVLRQRLHGIPTKNQLK